VEVYDEKEAIDKEDDFMYESVVVEEES